MNASQQTKETYFNYIGSITLPLDVIKNCSGSGDATENVKRSLELPEVKAELAEIEPLALIKELKEYGAWEDEELQNYSDNLERILWIAACNISDELVYILKHKKEIIFEGTENECYFKLQRVQSQSSDWAMKYEGYTISVK